MKKVLLLTFTALFSALTTVSAAPSIAAAGVYNSASYALAGFPNAGIAQGSIFVVFGSGMGPTTIVYNSALPYQTSLPPTSGTSVSVTVSGTTVNCFMFYSSAAQIAAILPSNTPVGTGTITVTYSGATSPTAPITVVKSALGLFTRNQQGSGPGVIQDSTSAYNDVANAFHPGQTVTFWGTGLGPITVSDATTPPSGNLPGVNVTATVGGQSAVVQYAGRSGYAGEDQINVTIPSGVTGCYVPVYMTVNNIVTNFVTMSIAATGSVCSDASFYSSSDLQNILNGGSFSTGNLDLTQFALSITVPGIPISIPPIENESGSGTFLKYDANTFVNSLGGLSTLTVTAGSCSVFQFKGTSYVDPVTTPGLDAGPVINVNGPGGAKQLTKTSTGNYSATFVTPSLNPLTPATKYLVPGSYTLDNGTGGTDVGAFKVNITVPTALTWTNKASVTTVVRSQPLPITWSGGDPNALVYVIGESPLATDASGNFVSAGEFVCVGKGSDGGLTVPSAILSAMPPSATVSEGGGISLAGGFMTVNSSNITRATAPGLNVFLAGASTGDGKAGVNFQ